MKEQIGQTAGTIWDTLRSRQEVNLTQMPRVIKEKSPLVYQALGWLARENKIEYVNRGEKTYVTLSESERNS